MRVKRGDVESFLLGVRKAIDNMKFYYDQNRAKNRRFMSDNGIHPNNVQDTVYNLSVRYFCERAVIRDRSEVFVLGVEFNEKECFVKLELMELSGIYYCTCRSFHKAERPMIYPFQEAD